FSSVWDPDAEPTEPAAASERFEPEKHHWVSFPQTWDDVPEERFLSMETQGLIREAIDMLPASQREVITLRDLQGWTSDEVCNVLDISETNQRVLLHRARSKVRHALEDYLGERA